MGGCLTAVRGIFGGSDKLTPSSPTINEKAPLLPNGKIEEMKAPLSLWKFVFLAYFCVCGGPYGLEEAIGAGFPGLTLLFIVVLPWIYSLPLALASAEMGSAMPDNDGFVLWVKSTWGPFWGYVSVAMNWFNYIADNALYPVLFMNYLGEIVGHDHWMHQPIFYYTLQFGLMFAIFLLNLAGVDLVGNASTLFAILILSPFLVLFLWSAAVKRIDPHDLIKLPPVMTLDGATQCLNVVVWGYTSYESLGSIVEELKEPKKNFVRSMLWLILLSIATYLMAFLGTVSLDTNYAKWDAGYFATVSGNLGGEPLKIVMTVAAMVSSVGTYNALLCTSSQELRALGKPDLLGSKVLRWKHPYFRTPWTAILINSIGAAVFSLFSFGELVVMNNIIYGCILLMIFATLVRMRYTHKDLERPYKISESNLLTAIIVSPGCMISLYIIASSVKTSPVQLGIVCAMFVAASASYFLLQYFRKRSQPVQKPDSNLVGIPLHSEDQKESSSDSD